ncbi:MAG: hypothetical protein AB7E48_06205 [Deferribacterales bacterium]
MHHILTVLLFSLTIGFSGTQKKSEQTAQKPSNAEYSAVHYAPEIRDRFMQAQADNLTDDESENSSLKPTEPEDYSQEKNFFRKNFD